MTILQNLFSQIAYVAKEPNFIGRLVQALFEALGGTGKYWLTVILFTLLLKLLTSPLDYWQKLTGKKNALKLEKIKPQLEAVQKKYSEDKNALNMKQNELYKSVGYSPLGACLPMILVIAVMIFMFSGLNTFATYKQIDEFNDLHGEYYAAINTFVNGDDGYFVRQGEQSPQIDITNISQAVDEFDTWYFAKHGTEPDKNTDKEAWTSWRDDYLNEWTAFCDEMIEKAATAVDKFYEENRESFIWIKNIWRSDNFWTAPVASESDFKELLTEDQQSVFDDLEYSNITGKVSESMGKANGLLILPLLAMVLMYFSSKITSKTQATGMPQSAQMASQQKMMQWMMPLMMGVFGLMYTSAVALYMIMNSVFTVLLSFVMNFLVDIKMKKMRSKTEDRPGYRR